MCRATRRLVSSPRLPSPRRLYSSPKETPTTPDCARKTPLHPERYYPYARIRVFHHSGPEIPGSAREGKPRSFFLCLVVGESHMAMADLFAKNPVLFHKVGDGVLLMLVHPPSDGDE